MTGDSAVRIGLVFPDLLGTYGDRGNATVLCQRLARRGLAAELVTVNASDDLPASLDCYVIGGGEDRAERAAAPLLQAAPLLRAWEGGASIVAVCAGFQLLGTDVELSPRERVTGVGLIDAVTRPAPRRWVGEVVVDPDDASLGALTGFENHRGVTTVHDDAPPLGIVRGDRRAEGILRPRLLASYLHGPLLARNPILADRVLTWTTGSLPPLESDDLAAALHDRLLARAPRR